MEYSRYIKFLENEEIYEFHTYLPIQLDATCNGFQHLAMLSNETILFEELNLISSGKDTPSDFYNFLVRKLNNMFSEKLNYKIVSKEVSAKQKDSKSKAKSANS